jgi:hypothetical protein
LPAGRTGRPGDRNDVRIGDLNDGFIVVPSQESGDAAFGDLLGRHDLCSGRILVQDPSFQAFEGRAFNL